MSELPYVVPILEQSFDHPDYVLVVVDHSGADITTQIGGDGRLAHKAVAEGFEPPDGVSRLSLSRRVH